jgi:deoxyadenosine/deoxycytidine kinase
MDNTLRIGIVGPCAAGKTTLITGLRNHGYNAKHIAQEHSYVPAMWQIMTHPDVLIFLDVAYEITLIRRKLSWTLEEYAEEQKRLIHARQHADLCINTDSLAPDQVLDQVLAFLHSGKR